MRTFSSVASRSSNKQSSTPVACSENKAKLTPFPIHVAPRGYGKPSQVRTEVINARAFMRHRVRIGNHERRTGMRSNSAAVCVFGRDRRDPHHVTLKIALAFIA